MVVHVILPPERWRPARTASNALSELSIALTETTSNDGEVIAVCPNDRHDARTAIPTSGCTLHKPLPKTTNREDQTLDTCLVSKEFSPRLKVDPEIIYRLLAREPETLQTAFWKRTCALADPVGQLKIPRVWRQGGREQRERSELRGDGRLPIGRRLPACPTSEYGASSVRNAPPGRRK